jgi:hypothetical protein
MNFQNHLQTSITLWIRVIQTESDALLHSKGVHIIYQIFVFVDNMHPKISMRYSIIYIHPFAMPSRVHSWSSNKKWRILKSMPSFSSLTSKHIMIACMALHNFIHDIPLRDEEFEKFDEDLDYMPEGEDDNEGQEVAQLP